MGSFVRSFFSLLSPFLLLGCLSSSYASETIRVSLAEEADGVRINANQEVRLHVPRSDTLVKIPPFVIQPDPEGLRIDGQIFTVPQVRIETASGTLNLSVLEGTSLQGKKRSPREWQIDGAVEVSHRGSKLLVVN